MFCYKCGKEIKDGQTFCSYCGTKQSAEAKPKAEMIWEIPVTAPVGGGSEKQDTIPGAAKPNETKSNEPQPDGAKKKKGPIIAIAVAALLVIAVGAGCILYFTGDSYVCRKNMKLAEEYFEDEDYEGALACYEDALKIDNTLTDAYLGAADVYLAAESYEEAMDILRKGQKKTRGDKEAGEALEEKLMEVYLAAAEEYTDQGNYERAYSLAKEGIEAIEDTSFQRKLQKIQEEIDANRVTGIYKLQYVEMAGMLVSLEEMASSMNESLDDLKVDLELKSDGKFSFDLSDLDPSLVMDGTYEVSGSAMTLVTEDGESIPATLEGGVITMSEETDGVTASMSFKKQMNE